MTDDLNRPANFDLYRRRAELIAQRKATKDPTERHRISVELEKLRQQELRERDAPRD